MDFFIRRLCGAVPYRLTNTIVEETDSNARREQHEKPTGSGKLGFVIIVAQLHVSILAEKHINKEQRPDYL